MFFCPIRRHSAPHYSLYRAVRFATLWFFCSVNHLRGPLRKHMFTCKSLKGHGLCFVIGRFRSVLFLWCFKVDCFAIILFRAIIDLFKLASQIFLIFLILVTCKNKATFAFLLRQKIHSPSRFPSLFLNSLESFSAKLGEHYIVICINPSFFKMIDGIKKPEIPSKFPLRAARYKEFRCKSPCYWSFVS